MARGNCPIAPIGAWGAQKPPPGVAIDRSHPLVRGLLGYWAMNEKSGRRLNDLSGNGYHGVRTGATGWAVTPSELILDRISFSSPLSEFSRT